MKKASESVEPNVGESVKIVKTLYGGNHPDGGKIRIHPPAAVRVLDKRTHRFRNPFSGEMDDVRMVTVEDIRTGEVFPEFKMGSLLHAAGLVQEEDHDAGSVLDVIDYQAQQRQTAREEVPTSPFAALSGLREELERQEAEAQKAAELEELEPESKKAGGFRIDLRQPGAEFTLVRDLNLSGKIYPGGTNVKVVSLPALTLIRVEMDGDRHTVSNGALYYALIPEDQFEPREKVAP